MWEYNVSILIVEMCLYHSVLLVKFSILANQMIKYLTTSITVLQNLYSLLCYHYNYNTKYCKQKL